MLIALTLIRLIVEGNVGIQLAIKLMLAQWDGSALKPVQTWSQSAYKLITDEKAKVFPICLKIVTLRKLF